MSSITEYGDKRVEAERKMIAEWLRKKAFPWLRGGEFREAHVEHMASQIERGEYRKGAGE